MLNHNLQSTIATEQSRNVDSCSTILLALFIRLVDMASYKQELVNGEFINRFLDSFSCDWKLSELPRVSIKRAERASYRP